MSAVSYEDEGIVHIITRCPALNQIRKLYIPKIKAVLQNLQYYNLCPSNVNSRESLTQFILDSNWVSTSDNEETIQHFNRLASELCHKLHLERTKLLRMWWLPVTCNTHFPRISPEFSSILSCRTRSTPWCAYWKAAYTEKRKRKNVSVCLYAV